MQRVVVTGLATITPIGNSLEESWQNLLAGKNGIGPITRFDCSKYDTQIAGEIKNFEVQNFLEPKQIKRLDRFCQYALATAKMLMQDAKWPLDEELNENLGVIVGCGLGGLETIESFHSKLLKRGPKKVSPFSIPQLISNMAAGQISIGTKAKGPNLVTTSACASGLHAIGFAYSEIKLGRVKAIITGGVESTITPMAVAGFNAMKALSTRNDEPEKASRPFDKDRDGFVIGEGCGLLLLESLESALERGATIYAEVVGFGASSDAYHMTAPKEDGEGMALAMQRALKEAHVQPEQIDHINAHGTSTKLNDLCETRAIKKVFGSHAYNILITANKSMIGHTLGAAGGIESVFSVLSLYHDKIPGTTNLETPDEECDLNYCANGSVQQEIEFALCNSFGFGGTNGSILFKKFRS
ncbi:3-oxoacyl-[acyl-carrier-protein] synthase II [Desulfonauticus submarinus]|uniref:3-oxoacyl-[acyl-carrier-protein] synthase 2 n=1 Tax=Desulfonauticus submarinus TaxID=206665 RepID=A0A1H0FF14_9BACT|nr:beta-ketoacyl-ACP synthase II [Desulfonauticus submarinus]SDN93348.1 3-oxoacyl-[acyl-carrier-protein] synthase II [Desulfonauticus submarinus]